MDPTKSQEFTLIINNSSELIQNKCDFEVNFSKPLELEQPSEIGLLEISLPKDLRTKKNHEPIGFTMHLIWIDRFFNKETYNIEDFLNKYQSDPNFDTSKIYKEETSFPYQTSLYNDNDDYDLRDYKFILNSLYNFFEKFAEKIMKIRFDKFNFENQPERDTYKIIHPKVEHDGEYFINKPGHIELKSSLENKYLWVAHLYLTFGKETHLILGFDEKIFPCIVPDHFKDKYSDSKKPEDVKAAHKVKEIGPIDNIYVYSDIVEETQVGNMKVNILRVFSRIDSDDEIITYPFYNMIFIPLRVQVINSIHVVITDSLGQTASSKRGEVNLVLIVRPIENR